MTSGKLAGLGTIATVHGVVFATLSTVLPDQKFIIGIAILISLAIASAFIFRPSRSASNEPEPKQRQKLSYDEALAELSKNDPNLPHKLKLFIIRCKKEKFFEDTQKTIMIKAEIPGLPRAVNFGTIGIPDGKLDTNYIGESAEKIGNTDIAVKYHEGIASLLDGAIVDNSKRPWTWRVKLHGDLPPVSKLLEKENEWLELMKEARIAFIDAANVGRQ